MYNRVHKYLDSLLPERPPILQEMEAYAAEHKFPIIGALVGRYLYQSARLIKARRILELGSGFGYSAFWFSLAVGARGEIILTDGNRGNKKRALDYFDRAALRSKFDFRVGDALKLAKRLTGSFDIILNDIDKKDYPATIDLAAARLRKGGLFVTDNVIWSGRVCDKKQDTNTQAIVEFTRTLYADSRFFTTILPLRDGLAVAIRL